MSKHTKEELLSEIPLPSENRERMNRKHNMIRKNEIIEKKLYYAPAVQDQILELRQLLEEEHYKNICLRLESAGFRYGFACLLYGEPGTGKTESVLQLARATGRDIFQINMSEIRSMWVGESEKNMKQIFDHYRNMVKEREIAPILLFNEADAIIGKRKKGVERAVDRMENTIQNIILQEMEDLNGILIATTNLESNLDKAFERRFLYKIKFTKPTLEARRSIWREKIPVLDDVIINSLASQYDFTGGQIENIARRYAIDQILYGSEIDVMQKLSQLCDNERIMNNDRSKKIGF